MLKYKINLKREFEVLLKAQFTKSGSHNAKFLNEYQSKLFLKEICDALGISDLMPIQSQKFYEFASSSGMHTIELQEVTKNLSMIQDLFLAKFDEKISKKTNNAAQPKLFKSQDNLSVINNLGNQIKLLERLKAKNALLESSVVKHHINTSLYLALVKTDDSPKKKQKFIPVKDLINEKAKKQSHMRHQSQCSVTTNSPKTIDDIKIFDKGPKLQVNQTDIDFSRLNKSIDESQTTGLVETLDTNCDDIEFEGEESNFIKNQLNLPQNSEEIHYTRSLALSNLNSIIEELSPKCGPSLVKNDQN